MGVLFGEKTIAWFDVWSIEHLIAGISAYSIACIVSRFINTRQQTTLHAERTITYLLLMLSAFMWETTEHYFEAGDIGTHAITYWFHGVEFWGNRMVTDPLLVFAGGWLGATFHWLIWPARLFSLLWLIIHIGFFPHSMYLHTLLA